MDQVRRNTALRYWFIAIIIFVATFTSCGGGSGSTGGSNSTRGSSSTGGSNSGGSTFQARPFPVGDFFVRLPNEGTDQNVPAVAYNPVLKEIFVSNPSKNTVEVYSNPDGHHVGSVSVPGPAGLSFSPDYTKLVVGTVTAYFYFVDPTALHITAQVAIPPSLMASDSSGSIGLFPIAPFMMAGGHILFAMGGNWESHPSLGITVSHLISYDPASGVFTPLDPPNGSISLMPVRSLDGKNLLVSGVAQLFVYSTGTGSYSAPFPVGNIDYLNSLAINSDGSQFVSLVTLSSGTQQLQFWNPNLPQGSTVALTQLFSSAVFSRDGKYLYLMNGLGLSPELLALNTQDASVAGYLEVSIGSLSVYPLIFDVDENHHVFGSTPGGAFSVNASQLTSTPPAAYAIFTGPSTAATPNAGPLSGGTQVQFNPTPGSAGSSDGIDSTMEAYFGGVPATNEVVSSPSSSAVNSLTATAPPASVPGPVSVVLTDASNNVVFLPDEYTYGPHILRVSPNVVSTKGGSDQITITAYGLGFFDQSSIQVKIGGAYGSVLYLNSYSYSGYPEQSVTVSVPQGTPGWADVTLTTPDGSDTLKRGVQYAAASAEGQTQQAYYFSVYDASRDRFYLTGGNNVVTVFDVGTQTLLQPMQSSSISAGALLRSEALTPDNSKLVVADPADGTVVVFDLASGTSSAISALLPSDPPVTVPMLMSVAVASGNRAFVSINTCATSPVREIDLTSLTVQPRPDAAASCNGSYPQFSSATADGSRVVFDNGYQPYSTPSLWLYDAASDSFGSPVTIQNQPWQGGNPAVSGDGNVIVFSGGTLDQNLLPLVPIVLGSTESHLNDTGSLLYNASAGLSDTHNGHAFLSFSNSPVTALVPLATDPSGRKTIFFTQTGLSYYELSVVPLAIGSVSPALTSAGSSITIRGSGFVSATTVTIGGQNAACTYLDTETLTCTVPSLKSGPAAIALSNPDGQTYSYENAITVQ